MLVNSDVCFVLIATSTVVMITGIFVNVRRGLLCNSNNDNNKNNNGGDFFLKKIDTKRSGPIKGD